MTTVPWDYSAVPAPGEGVPNVRSPEGAMLGRELARLVDVEEERQRERFPNMLPRCDDCAGRLGTLPNECAETQMDLVKCAVEGRPFYCHKGVKEGEHPKRLCTAWVVLQSSELSSALPQGAHSLIVCPDCLSRDLVFVVSIRGEACRRCGVVATEPLTRKEIRECFKARRLAGGSHG